MVNSLMLILSSHLNLIGGRPLIDHGRHPNLIFQIVCASELQPGLLFRPVAARGPARPVQFFQCRPEARPGPPVTARGPARPVLMFSMKNLNITHDDNNRGLRVHILTV